MSDCDHQQWQQSHDYRPLETTAERQAWRVTALSGVTMLVEIIAGYWFNSMALLADGWHMASHMVALGLSALAYFIARRYAKDQRFAFGTWKVEVLAGFASAVMLTLVVLMLAFESLLRLFNPQVIAFDMALVVAVIGLLVNLLSAWMLRDQHEHGHELGGHAHADHCESHDHGDHGGRDLNRHAAFIHVMADALTSVAAIAALVGGMLFGWNWLDPLMGVIGSVIIAVWAKGLLIETAMVLLDREMDSPVVERIRTNLERQADTQVTDLHAWRVGRTQFACAVSVVTHQQTSADDYKQHLAQIKELVHVTVEVNQCPVDHLG